MEQELKLVTNGDFKNLHLKPNIKKGIEGLEDGNYAVVGKVHKEGLEKEGMYGKYYICRVNYRGDECSFILNEKEHAAFSACGDLGDDVKITLKKETIQNYKTGVEMIVKKLYFERA